MSTPESPRIGIIDTYPHMPTMKPKINVGVGTSHLEVTKVISLNDKSSADILRVLGFHVSDGSIASLDPEVFKNPTALTQVLTREFTDLSHILVFGNQRIPEGVIKNYEGKAVRIYPGALDPTNIDANGDPLDFGRLEGKRPSYASLAFALKAKGPFSTAVSVQHIEDDSWIGELSDKAHVSYSWVSIRGGQGLDGERKGLFTSNAESIHEEVLATIPRVLASFMKDISREKKFPRISSSQKLISDGKEHLLFEARKLAQEFPA